MLYWSEIGRFARCTGLTEQIKIYNVQQIGSAAVQGGAVGA